MVISRLEATCDARPTFDGVDWMDVVSDCVRGLSGVNVVDTVGCDMMMRKRREVVVASVQQAGTVNIGDTLCRDTSILGQQ
jgi:hypothetical protein